MLKLCSHRRLLASLKWGLNILVVIAMFTGIRQAHAQNAGRWYEIEVIFFNQGLGRADRQELWPQHIELNYPASVKVLSEPPETPLTDEPDSPLNTDEERMDVDGIPRQTPFQRLGEKHQRLSDVVQKIKASGRHRILAHWVWQQPVMGRKAADSIAIVGGRQFDDHYELEGNIDLSVGRYLHVATNLWLTRFTRISDDVTTFNPWPPLPNRPQQALIADNETEANTSPDETSEVLNTLASSETGQTDANIGDEDGVTLMNASRRFQPERIALIQEKRRMRSAKLHFIDHPLMGILLEIRRVNPE